MQALLDRIVDGLDFETFIRAQNEDDAKNTMIHLVRGLGFQDVGIVFLEWKGSGARVRARATINRPGDRYGWLSRGEVASDVES